MAALIKSLFKTKKPRKDTAQQKEEDDCELSRRGSRRNERLSPTAAYHTVTQSRSRRGPSSCPGDISDNATDRQHVSRNRSFESDINIENMILRRRRHHQIHRLRRANAITSEYGSGNPSPTTLYSTYNPNLDDSESDSWTAEYERSQHIKELECKLREQKKKLKDYKEKLRAERDLRITNERTMMEEVEKYKRELRKEQKERKVTEQRYIEIITTTRTKLSFLEQQQSMGQRFQTLPPMPILSEKTINACGSLPQRGGAGEFMCPMTVSVPPLLTKNSFEQQIQEVDETKNFRAEASAYAVETPRNSKHTTSTSIAEQRDLSTTLLRSDDSDNDHNGYITTSECQSRVEENKKFKKFTSATSTSL